MFNRLKIASKLLIGFGLLVLLLAGVSAISTISDLKSKDSLEGFAARKANEVLDQQIQKEVVEASMDAWISLATGNQELWKQSDDAMKSVDKQHRRPLGEHDGSSPVGEGQATGRIDPEFQASGEPAPSRSRAKRNPDAAENKAMSANALKIGADILTFGNALSDE